MARQTVLLTGVSGFIGFRVLLETLERDYDVRAVVRSEEKANIVQSNPAFQKLVRESQISFVTIADFLAPGAFDQALQGVDFVIHVASPNVGQQPADGDFEKFYVDAAVRNTLMVLDGAKRIDTIKKVVITSSAGAFLSGDIGPYTAESRLPDPAGPYTDSMSAYFASKAAALNSTDRWIEREKPHFDVVNIFPAFVFGRDELCDSTADFQRTTNNLIVNVALGNAARAMSLPFVYTTINDAALAHVLALDSKIAGNRGYLVCNYGEEGGWDDVLSIIEKRYADQVKRGDFKPSETWSTQPWKGDVSTAQDAFGITFGKFEDAVTPLLDQYVEVLQKEQAQKA